VPVRFLDSGFQKSGTKEALFKINGLDLVVPDLRACARYQAHYEHKLIFGICSARQVRGLLLRFGDVSQKKMFSCIKISMNT
jgi:hypothetical protein